MRQPSEILNYDNTVAKRLEAKLRSVLVLGSIGKNEK